MKTLLAGLTFILALTAMAQQAPLTFVNPAWSNKKIGPYPFKATENEVMNNSRANRVCFAMTNKTSIKALEYKIETLTEKALTELFPKSIEHMEMRTENNWFRFSIITGVSINGHTMTVPKSLVDAKSRILIEDTEFSEGKNVKFFSSVTCE